MKSYSLYPGFRFLPGRTRFVSPYRPTFYSDFQASPAVKTPYANILREEAAYVIQLAVPGLNKADIKIEVINDELVISSTANVQENDRKMIRNEFSHQGFKRTFRLHKNANTNALTANFNQGLLTIVIPDREPETRKIAIQ